MSPPVTVKALQLESWPGSRESTMAGARLDGPVSALRLASESEATSGQSPLACHASVGMDRDSDTDSDSTGLQWTWTVTVTTVTGDSNTAHSGESTSGLT
jgi:hypothetical protein